MLPYQGRSSGDVPRGTVVDPGGPRVGESAVQLRMLNGRPESSVMEVPVIDQTVGASYCPPGKAAFLAAVVYLILSAARDEFDK